MERKYILYDNNRLRANIPWSTAEIKAMQPEKTENNKNNKNIELNRMYCVRRFYGFCKTEFPKRRRPLDFRVIRTPSCIIDFIYLHYLAQQQLE